MQAKTVRLRILLNVSCLWVCGYREVSLLPLKVITASHLMWWSARVFELRVFELMILNSKERSRMHFRRSGCTWICLGSPSAGGCAHPSFSFRSDFCWYNFFEVVWVTFTIAFSQIRSQTYDLEFIITMQRQLSFCHLKHRNTPDKFMNHF